MHRTRRCLAALAAVAAGSAAFATSAGAAFQAFSYQGDAVQSWTVPAGVTQATFTLQGAGGGMGSPGSVPSAGGLGSQVTATIPVQQGQRYAIVVGGAGAPGAAGGFNGGGAAGNNPSTTAGSGGDATDVRPFGAGPAERLLVAAGGGGGGAPGDTSGINGAGGAGGSGGANGVSGQPVSPGSTDTPGGGGLFSGLGGSAGRGTADGAAGGAGTLVVGFGGAGGTQLSPGAGGNGGGGGGGWVGGGGGGAGASNGTMAGAGGGGGAGGQSYANPLAQNPAITPAAQAGNGVALVTYEALTPPEVRTQPTLSGVALVGRALTCELGTWTGTPALGVAWLRNGTPIAGATSAQYTVATADVGQQLACQVTATNAAGSTIARTPAIGVTSVTGPANSVLPAITGTSAIGSRLTCSTGTWSGTPAYAYTWLRNGVAIANQNAPVYTAVKADAGQVLQCAVRATADGLTATAQSAAFGGPSRLIVLGTVALVSRTGAVTVPVVCVGPTACRIPSVTVSTAGLVIARSGARTVRSGASSRIALRLGRRGISRLSRAGSAITVRFVSTPTGGYGGNARSQFIALRGASL